MTNDEGQDVMYKLSLAMSKVLCYMYLTNDERKSTNKPISIQQSANAVCKISLVICKVVCKILEKIALCKMPMLFANVIPKLGFTEIGLLGPQQCISYVFGPCGPRGKIWQMTIAFWKMPMLFANIIFQKLGFTEISLLRPQQCISNGFRPWGPRG